MTDLDAGERNARRIHFALLALTAAGIAVWLWRVYGFEPLRIVEPATR
jgi:hypothetical protein